MMTSMSASFAELRIWRLLLWIRSKGRVFYTLDQVKSDKPKFTLQPTDCLACHDTFKSEKPVPRLLMLSVLSDPTGVALNRSSVVTNDKSPFVERWGGWYVTGTHGSQRHMGNHLIREPAEGLGTIPQYSKRANLSAGANLTDLTKRFDTKPYLTQQSDIVALMVLGHQTHIHNLITVASTSLRSNPTESEIKEETESARQRDAVFSGRSADSTCRGNHQLCGRSSPPAGRATAKVARCIELDLKTRLLRYPLSYLVYSKSFDAMPKPAKDYVYRRFWEVLSGKDTSDAFTHLSTDDRKVILEILQETKPDFAAFVKQLG